MEDINQCRHCGQTVEGNFCSNCGQKNFTRINRTYVQNEIAEIIQTNRGLFYTLKNLVLRPGQMARKFVDGDRIKHFKPLLLLFVLGGFSSYLSYKVLRLGEVFVGFNPYENSTQIDTDVALEFFTTFMDTWNSFTYNYMGLILVAMTPVYALLTKLVFKSWGHNYYEHIAINAYYLSLQILIGFVIVYPLYYIFKDNPKTVIFISYLSYLYIPVLLSWFYRGFYADRTPKEVNLKVLSLLGLILGAMLVMGILLVIVGIIFALLGIL